MSIANEQLMIKYFEEVWNNGRLDILDEIIAHWRVTDELSMLRQLGQYV